MNEQQASTCRTKANSRSTQSYFSLKSSSPILTAAWNKSAFSLDKENYHGEFQVISIFYWTTFGNKYYQKHSELRLNEQKPGNGV